jgi:hypothetical protein
MANISQQSLSESDVAFIRVIDDLIAVLVEKNVISLDDLPKPARDKYNARHKLRFQVQGIAELLEDVEEDED